tara:strand:+ start:345 stop:1490 length:1146 start_codon:yes stop_codon:yes gene_type:complete
MQTKQLFLIIFFFIIEHNYCQINSFESDLIDYNLYSDTIKNRLARLDAKTPLELYFTPEVEKRIKRYLKTRVDFYNDNIEKINYYLPLFEEHLQNNQIPIEIKYLPIIESRLDPTAVSKVGATGLWQFMFYTALENDLKMNSYIDERMDPLKSTIAATAYLKKLYKIHSDWNLVLASYNAGPRTISRAKKQSGGHTNYWNIRPFLPTETANYVPSFIATMYLLEYADEHGINLHISKRPILKTEKVLIKEKFAFEYFSKFFNYSIDSIKTLNPSYIHGIIPGQNVNSVRLPIELADKLIENEDEFYAFSKTEFDKREKPLPDLYSIDSKLIYKVSYGEFLGKIARKFGVKVADIKRWNNLKNDNIKENQKLIIFPKRIPKN